MNLLGLGFQHEDYFLKIHRTAEFCHSKQITSHVIVCLSFLYSKENYGEELMVMHRHFIINQHTSTVNPLSG